MGDKEIKIAIVQMAEWKWAYLQFTRVLILHTLQKKKQQKSNFNPCVVTACMELQVDIRSLHTTVTS